ncbi:MAG TPA: DoxX family protein [Candidatus Nanoarchaeia archaeon]|nr:DoxX family protein [Candidatus Nanoarchaeia archaeon]
MNQKLASIFLRWGIGILFLWMGISKLLDADMRSSLASLSEQTFLVPAGFGVAFITLVWIAEIVTGALLLIGIYTKTAGWIVTFLMLGSLFVLNWVLPDTMLGPWGPFIIKDIGLLGAGLALAFGAGEHHHS